MKKLFPAFRAWVSWFVIGTLFPIIASAQEQNDTIIGEGYLLENFTVTTRRIPFKITM